MLRLLRLLSLLKLNRLSRLSRLLHLSRLLRLLRWLRLLRLPKSGLPSSSAASAPGAPGTADQTGWSVQFETIGCLSRFGSVLSSLELRLRRGWRQPKRHMRQRRGEQWHMALQRSGG